MVLMVIGFRVVVRAAPNGECELHLTLATGASFCDIDIDDVALGRHICEAIRTVFIVARDTFKSLQVQEEVVVWRRFCFGWAD